MRKKSPKANPRTVEYLMQPQPLVDPCSPQLAVSCFSQGLQDHFVPLQHTELYEPLRVSPSLSFTCLFPAVLLLLLGLSSSFTGVSNCSCSVLIPLPFLTGRSRQVSEALFALLKSLKGVCKGTLLIPAHVHSNHLDRLSTFCVSNTFLGVTTTF